jgi:formylglycine-generating enzyme required for sulfatase activity
MTTTIISLLALSLGSQEPFDRKAYEEKIPGTLVSFKMLPIPDGEFKGEKIKNLYAAETEVTWDLFDIYTYRLDLTAEQIAANVEVESRPSRPYGAADRGFGHAGYAALGMKPYNANLFCAWLSKKTGKKYRLPTEAEWEYLARAGATSEPSNLEEVAWFWDNADGTAQPVGKKKPNAWGLYDTLGNVGEWATRAKQPPVLCGGSWNDKKSAVGYTARQVEIPKWNDIDPQNPKSKWWVYSAPFVGFRVVCEG